MKSKQLVLIAIALLCGLVSAIGIIQAMGNKGDVASSIPMGPVLVASEHLDHKAELSETNVRLENWPLNLIPEGAATELTAVSGKFITTRLRSGQAIILDDVANRNDILGLAIPPGHKVINIKVPPEDILAGLLSPGDRVDIIGVFNIRDRSGEQTSETKTFLKGIRIFNIGTSTSAQAKAKAGTVSGIVGVLVTEPQSEKIVWARKNGEIRLAMIGDQVASDEEDPDFEMNLRKRQEETVIPKPTTGILAAAPVMPSIDKSKLRQVKVYTGNTVKITYFDEDGVEVNMEPPVPFKDPAAISFPGFPGQTTPSGAAGIRGRPQVDYENFDGSAEIPNGIEEDQYPGE